MGRTHVFEQLLTPVADSLGLYFIAARLPILTVLVRTFPPQRDPDVDLRPAGGLAAIRHSVDHSGRAGTMRHKARA
jgi:hypothetical protein